MYASFFGLRELPFNNSPDPRFFFSTPDHEEALASLIYAVTEQKGFVLLTGEVGSGKTLVTRLMLKHFGDAIAFASITNTHVTAGELLHNICAEFDIEVDPSESNPDVTRKLQDFLVTSFARNKPVVLMLDEAQALSREAFEQVRMIGNLEADDAKLLQIVIVGQPELRERFEANDMRQLRQRIFRSFHLPALNREQTRGYIHHRLGVAGAQQINDIFDDDAIDAIHKYSQGLPRLINTVCDNAMLSAYASDQPTICGADVRNVIEQMMSIAQGGPKFASPRVAPALDSPSTYPPNPMQPQSAAMGVSQGIVFSQSTNDLLGATYASEQAAMLHGAVSAAKGLVSEIRSIRAELDESIRAARDSRRQADQATRKMAEQASRVGRMAIAVRDICSRTSHRSESNTADRTNSSATRTEKLSVSKKARNLDHSIKENRKMLDDVRQLIATTAEATSQSMNESGSSRLVQQVRELTDLIESQRSQSTVI